jgi:hypothetical protein
MRRLALSCCGSLLVYVVLFGFVLDRPLAYGFLRHQIDAKLSNAGAHPKLVIIAGSNGPYSHRCEVIEPIIGRICINAGVAVGIGLDYLFTRWRPLLQPGDVVYLPMEEAQYVRTRVATAVGPDAAIMFRHDWATLAHLAPRRWPGAVFAFDLRYGLMSLVEAALVAARFDDPRGAVTGETNGWGDHVGHTLGLADQDRATLAKAIPWHATAQAVRDGDGAALIAEFVRWGRTHGVRMIGGWAAGFDDAPMPTATREAIRAVYEANGGEFLELPNRSLYPRNAFFDSPEHLAEPGQIAHSRMLGALLAGVLHARPQLAAASRGGFSCGAATTGPAQQHELGQPATHQQGGARQPDGRSDEDACGNQ